MAKAFFIDTSRCTACRGCQVACKEWYELPANDTRQTGSHQNPPDLNPFNYKVVRFSEHLDENGVVKWFFVSDQCRHCLDPPCYSVAMDFAEGAVIHDKKTGAVVYNEKTMQIPLEGFEEIRESCPYNIPRRNPETGLMSKCTMCHERVVRGLLPVCVQVCPTGAMNFGERKDMLVLAEKRLKEVQREHPAAMLVDPDKVRVIFLLTEIPEYYTGFVMAGDKRDIDRQQFLARFIGPVRRGLKRTIGA